MRMTPARQKAIDRFEEVFLTNAMPQSKESNNCIYEHPTIPHHGCAIGILPGFSSLSKDARTFQGSVDELIDTHKDASKLLEKLGFDLSDKSNDLYFLEALQGLHDCDMNWIANGDRFNPAAFEEFLTRPLRDAVDT